MRALFLLFLVAGLAAAQSGLPAALDQIAVSELSRQKIPGVAAVVVKDNQVVWATGLGVASLESKTPVTPDTLFRLGSARVYLAAAAYELSAQGRLRLETPAGDYLFGLDDRQARLSAQNLLSPPSEAGEEAVVARLIENIRARPASAVLEEMIFTPLGMAHTTFAPNLAMTYPLAMGHTADGKIVRPMAGEGLFSSASDMARFLLVFLNDGKVRDQPEEREVLPPTVIAALSSDSGYGLEADASRGVRLIRQTSTAPGFAGAILMAPEFHTGVVVLANRDGSSAITIAQKLLERSLPVRFPQSLAIVR
ncbi:MAG: beta-lactamase family protein [Acidobacteriia bacterium]|nr:beta-lactamase family protein [Terriglobia bacterium]